MIVVDEWPLPPPAPSLSKDTVHVWRARLDVATPRLGHLVRHLSEDERARASRFRSAADRRRFIAARGSLREILALYSEKEASRLRFGQGARGKPFLTDSELRFNVSRSLDTMLVAVAHQREVGIDIEHLDPRLPVDEIGQATLTPPEKRVMRDLDGEPGHQAFLRLWARKEAFVKADGRGLSLPLEHVDVSLPEGRVAVLDETTGNWVTSSAWLLRRLPVGPEAVAALAAADREWHVVCWRWEGAREVTAPC